MSSNNDSTRKREHNIPQVILSEPSLEGEVPRASSNTRGRRPSHGPALTVNTNLGPHDQRSRSSSGSRSPFAGEAESEDDAPLSAATSHRSPVSSFFSKFTASPGKEQKLSPMTKKVANMVPYIKTPEHSKSNTSVDTFHSAPGSFNKEETNPEVLNRGLKVALGDTTQSIGGLWLPVASPERHGSGSDGDYDNDDYYDNDEDSLTDEPHQEGIRLKDFNINVPSYPEYLATTTTPLKPVPSNETATNIVGDDTFRSGHVTFDKDVENGLKVPTLLALQPSSPRHQISNAFKKFSARVNGRDYDDDDDEIMARSPILSNSELESDEEYLSDETDEADTAGAIFDNVDQEEEEGSSGSNNDFNDSTFPDKKSQEHIKYPEVIESDDNVSYATAAGLSGFEEIRSRLSAKDTVKKKEDIRLFGNSLKYFTPQSKLRLFCSSIVFTNTFELLITLLTFTQAGLLSYEQWDSAKTGYYNKGTYTTIDWLLFAINIFHTFEIFLKIITYGLYDDSQMFKALNIPQDRQNFWKDYVRYNYQRFKNRKRKSQSTESQQQQQLLLLLLNPDYDSRFHLLDTHGKLLEKRPRPIHSVTAYELEDTTDYSNIPFTRAYLRSSWNRIDFVSSLSFWISFLLSINHYDLKHHIMLFRSLMCLRILRLTNFTHGTSVILKAVKKASPELLDIALFLGCFWILFAIIGVQSFKSSLRRNCVWFNPQNSTDYYVNDSQYCGSYLDLGTLKPMPYVYNDGTPGNQIKGFRCPVNSKCVSNQNPYGNSVSFDNIANSFELVFVVMSANTFTDLMYDTMDTDTMAASLFYIFGIFFLTVWIVNLLIAVIVNAFKITRDEVLLQRKKQKKKATFTNMRNKILYNDFKRKSISLKWYFKIEPIFLILILISLIFQSLKNDKSSPLELYRDYTVEAVITVLLLLEIIIRFSCFFPKWRYFFHSKQNIFDLFLAIVTSIMVIPPVHHHLGRGYAWMSVFQIARWYRLVLSIGFVRRTWLNVLGHVKTIFDLALFYLIFLYLTSIIMSRFFEGTITLDELEDNAFSMYNLPNSFISLYAITSTENWTDTLYAVQEYAKNKSQQFFGAAYLIVWFIFSNMIVLNIFIAVISENLSVPESEKRKEQIQQYLEQLRKELKQDSEKGILADFKESVFQPKQTSSESREEILYLLLSGKVKGFTDDVINKTKKSDSQQIPGKKAMLDLLWRTPYIGNFTMRVLATFNDLKTNPFFASEGKTKVSTETHDLGNAVKGMMDDDKRLTKKKEEYLKENPTFNTVFYMLPPNHKLRRFCQKIVPPSYGDRVDGVNPHRTVSFLFSFFMFLITLAMVIIACYATPLYKKKNDVAQRNWDWLTNSDMACTLLFSFEFLIKVFADGLIYTPNAYLASSWNHIDLIVLLTLWINLITTLRGSGSVSRVINGFKALRALRLLTLSARAKSTFQNTIIAGFWQILSAATISVTLLFPFTIWGLNLLNGRLGYCLDGSSTLAECYGEFKNEVFKWNIVSPNAYVQPPLHLNSFKDAFLSLFEIISLEGWVDLLENLMNSTGVGTVPGLFATPLNGIYVVLFNAVSTIFILTLFVSVIIQNYARNTGRAYETSEQSSWYEVEKILRQVKASRRGDVDNYSNIQLICHKLIVQRNRYWRLFINMTFILHILALLLEVYPTIEALDDARYIVYIITSGIFLIHFNLVIIARGPKTFFSSKWGWMSLVIFVGAFATTLVSFFISRETVYANMNKLFLVAVLLMIIPRIDRLEQLLRYALASLPSLISLLYTWGILFLVYAIALNQIFGLTRTGPNTSNNINTRTVTKSLILLFRMSFGEGWNYIMNDYAVVLPNCYSSDNIYLTDCGSRPYAYLLFISWNVLSMFIFLNMFVSLIVDSFSYIYHGSDPHSFITRSERRKFKASWLRFDPRGTGFIDPNDLEKLLGSLNGVLSYKIYNDGRFTIPELKKQWFKQVDDDPYSVFIDYPAMNATLSQIDPNKVNIRRLKYERLVEEILMDMRANNHPGVSFTSVILKVALYAHFEENKCLTLSDFMERYVSMDKVDAGLRHQKVYNTLRTVIARWRYKKGQFDKLVESTDVQSFQNFNEFEAEPPKPPLIFISEYLRSEEDVVLRGRAATFSSLDKVKTFNTTSRDLSRNNNDITDEADNPFVNPFGDEIGEEVTFSKSRQGSQNLDLHFRPQKAARDQFSFSTKDGRNLTGSSSALSEAPIIKVQPPIMPFNTSRNTSKDSLYSVLSNNFVGDTELDSLLSVDLSSPGRR